MGLSCAKVGDSYVVEPRRPNNHATMSWTAGYLTREDVHTMLVQLQRDQPEDLEGWMKRYPFGGESSYPTMRPSQNSSQGTGKLTPSLHRSATGTIGAVLTEDVRKFQEGDKIKLDWRYYMFNAEREVLESSRNMVRKQMERGYIFRTPSANSSNQFHSFLPQTIVKAIESEAITREDTHKVMSQALINNTYNAYNPIKDEFEAVVVMMDASGFTALTEKLAKSKNGAEEIGACLNAFFAPLIELVVSFGGDILKFSGDAITILWPTLIAPPTSTSSLRSARGFWREQPQDAFSPAARAAYLACCCCLEVQRQMPRIGQTSLPDVRLTLHIGVGMGPLKILQLGGVMNRWEYCAVGPPLEEVAEAEPLAKPGEIVVVDSICKALQGCPKHAEFRFTAVSNQSQSANQYMLVTANASLRPEVAKQFVSPAQDTIAPSLPKHMVERYIPHACLRSLRGGSAHQAEVRQISVVFLQLQNIDPGRGDASLAVQVQLVMRLLQRSCYALEGSVNKFLVDDKGMLLLTVFGLPPLNHYTDDPLRAAMAAVRFCDTLREEDLAGRAGVATGRCWCGIVGSKLRREYTVLGDTVNTSARLMAAADENKVLVDSATHQACEKNLTFDRMLEVAAKGKAERLKVYEFTGTMKVHESPEKRHVDTILLSWNGWPARQELEEKLEAQLKHEGGRGGTVYVRGGPGRGKKEIFTAVKMWGNRHGFKVLRGENMNHLNTFPMQMLCWQEVFRDLSKNAFVDPFWHNKMELESNDNAVPTLTPGVLFRLLYTMLQEGGADQDLLAWAPLLSIVFPTLDFGQKLVQAMLERDEQHSFDKSRLAELCVKVMDSYCRFGAGSSGTVVCLHMLTSTSFFQEADIHTSQICRAMVDLSMQRVESSAGGPLIFCVISRHGLLPDDVLSAKATECGGLVTINDLSLQDTKEYILRYLSRKKSVPDLTDIEQVLLVHIYRVSGGNLFAIRELAEQLWNSKVMQAKDGRIRATRGWSDPRKLQNQEELPYPDRLLGHTVAQFEKLSPEDQSIIRHAAVYCQETEKEEREGRWTFTARNIDSLLTEDEKIEIGVGKLEERLDLLVEDGILAGGAEPLGFELVKFSSEGPYTNNVDAMEPAPSMGNSENSAYFDSHDNTKRYIFVSQLMRHVASMFILNSEVKTWVQTISQNPSTGRIRGLRDQRRTGISRFLIPVPTPPPTYTP